MEQIISQIWMGTFQGAFCEFDPNRLLERIGLAKAAIYGRLCDLKDDLGHYEERHLMAHALRTLSLLRSSTSDVNLSREEEEDEDEENEEPKEQQEDETTEGYSE